MLVKRNLFASSVCILYFVVLRIQATSICDWEENAFRPSGTYTSIRLAVPENVDEVEVNDVSMRLKDGQCAEERLSDVESCKVETYEGYSSLQVNFKQNKKVEYIYVRIGHESITAQSVPSKPIGPNEYGFVFPEDQQFHFCPAKKTDSIELTWNVEGHSESGRNFSGHYSCSEPDDFYCIDSTTRIATLEAQLEAERSNSTKIDFTSDESIAAMFYSTKCKVEMTPKGFKHTLKFTRPGTENVSYYYCYVSPSSDPYLSYTVDWTGVGEE
ncbi:hypothetical protein SprV_0702444100 [Sparganum proliferum]